MSVKHRIALALSTADPDADYGHDVITTGKTATFVFHEAGSADTISRILRMIFKRPALIHKGGKP